MRESLTKPTQGTSIRALRKTFKAAKRIQIKALVFNKERKNMPCWELGEFDVFSLPKRKFMALSYHSDLLGAGRVC